MQTKQQHKNVDMLCKDTIAIWKGSNKNYFILDFELNSGLHQTQEEKTTNMLRRVNIRA